MLFRSQITPKGNSSYSYASQAEADARAAALDTNNCSDCSRCSVCSECSRCSECSDCSGEVIQAGRPNGWSCYGWLKDGALFIHCGCRRKTFAEAVEYWSNKPDRLEVLMACYYIASVAHSRGWPT